MITLQKGTHCAAVAVLLTLAGCSPAQPPAPPAPEPSPAALVAKAQADSVRRSFTPADVQFMTGMIGHHAQAITMARWAPAHGAGRSVQILAERIINAQQDEIVTMQQWLRDRGQPVPDAEPHAMAMHAHGHAPLMPGMLTEAQMTALDQARGAEFERLFLTFMIQHHRGALTMVEGLFGTHGAGQDDLIFKFASDVHTDQTTEIARMERMLAALAPPAGSAP